MARYRLRYQGTDLELPQGPFVIGRSSSCNLALDDALVSRRHATIEARSDGLVVEDLGSRNGVLVNGVRVERERRLAHLDRVTIGAHDLIVIEAPDQHLVRCDACGSQMVPAQGKCPRCGAPYVRGSATLVGVAAVTTVDAARVLEGSGRVEEPSAVSNLLTSLADKALALGRFDEAERVLSKVLLDVLARAQKGPIPAPRLAEATGYAIRLADGTRKASWVDWVFEVHAATGVLLAPQDIDRLHEIVRRIKYTNGPAVRRYLEKLAQRGGDFSPAERFQLQRIEGILRVVSA